MQRISLKGMRVFVKGRAQSALCVVPLRKGKMAHPVSEAQRRWAWAAEDKGELPEGTAHRWSKRVKGKKLPKHTEDGEPVQKGIRLVVKATGATMQASGRIRDRDSDPRLPFAPMTANERTVYEDREKELAGKGEKIDPKKRRPPRPSRGSEVQPHTVQDDILYGKGRR